ncbi:putative RNA-dependent RNA polymerase [Pythium nunn virus 1]|uniref:putative RNA-dependent RNA polymerase n=1 Tax=Pythium nunn virus 1 TaxID=2083275 RepID=UPI000DBB07B5|nr:putative RNA-dependent RNA polymerase [Pythium nunn virus 1]BBC77402.1 putative RNA-dependent RNA polymerase [Pythium nunn virus 1]
MTTKKTRAEVQEFLKTIAGKPGLRVVPDPNAYPYNVEETRMNTDPFVRKSMKLWSRETYEAQRGFTKRATLSNSLYTLQKYASPQRLKSQISHEFESCIESAIAYARHVFIPQDKLLRYSLAHGTDNMNLDSAAGFSYPGMKKAEVVEEAYDVAAYLQHMTQRGKSVYIPPCKVALRGHLSSQEEQKSRPVWVYPVEVTILESKWAIPFYEHLERNVETVHFGANAMPKLSQLLMGGLADHSEAAEITLDWSNFDSSIPNWLINQAFDIIWESFDNQYAYHEGEAVYGGEVMERKNINLFRWIKEYFINTKIMLPSGDVVRKTHGIPSGSFFTQAVGSIVNYIMVKALDLYFSWGARRIRILGDDSSFLIPLFSEKKCEAKAIQNAAWKAFGVTLKLPKLRISTTQKQRKFLGYQITGHRLFRDDDEFLKLVLYPERDVETLEQSASRVLAYYMLGGVNDEVYCSFFWDYLGRYPAVIGRELRLTRGMKRMFKFVLRQEVDVLRVPDFTKLDPTFVPYLMTLGDRPFSSN